MERVLDVSARPHDPRRPVLCRDERPCFLIGDVITPVPAEPGTVAKEDFMYEKLGCCAVLFAIEPLTGRRFVRVTARRTAAEYTAFMQDRDAAYLDAEQITRIQDNLNTPHRGSFYKFMAPEGVGLHAETCELVKHAGRPQTGAALPKTAELEFSARSRQCLDRRIPSMDVMTPEVESWTKAREAAGIILHGQFSTQAARTKLNRHYEEIRIN
jgi:DDE superfamily endonuclease